MTSTPLHSEPGLSDGTVGARARALELLGAYTAGVGPTERAATLDRVASEVLADPSAARGLLHAMTEYAATFADVAAAASSTDAVAMHPASLVHALARLDLTG